MCRSWPDRLPQERWALYKSVMSRAQQDGIPFAVGGGLAAMAYAGQWRDTKDLDLYIYPEHRDRIVQILAEAGLADYYDRLAYDRHWIYRSYRDDTIVDAIWAMANQRTSVDREWLAGPVIEIDDLQLRLLPPEETLWSKLYVLQRDRCDWPDAINMLYTVGAELNWHRFLERLQEDAEVLGGLLAVFRWVCPGAATKLPQWLWVRVGLCPGVPESQDCEDRRARLLDTREWFTPAIHDETRLMHD